MRGYDSVSDDDDDEGRGLEYACEGDSDTFENGVSIEGGSDDPMLPATTGEYGRKTATTRLSEDWAEVDGSWE